jgi:putative aminopeptidase FrvX
MNWWSLLSSKDKAALLQWATPDNAADVLARLANTHAPSQTPAWTRGEVISHWWADVASTHHNSHHDAAWDMNFQGTGNGILQVGKNPSKVWLVAHWDTISYLIGDQQGIGDKQGEAYALVPFCLHTKKHGQERALVVEYNPDKRTYEVVVKGTLHGGEVAMFVPDDASITLRAGQRVVFDTPVQSLGDDLYSGQFDNAAGCAAVLLAAAFLLRFDVSLLVALTDEEEGVLATGNSSFSRGIQRLLARVPPPENAIVSDLHTVFDQADLGQGASFREYASQTKGAVTPPWLYETLRDVANTTPELSFIEQTSNVSRSDDVSLMHATANVMLCGVPAVGRHYAEGADVVSSYDVAQLARVLVLLTLAAQRDWQC